jgi:flagellar assembly factor FliW
MDENTGGKTMLINTKHFGELEIDEKGIIIFDEGLPGFEDLKQYALLSQDDNDSPFQWLQSLDKPDIAFVVINPLELKKDYDIEVNDDILDSIGIDKPEDILLYAIVVIPQDIKKISMNLKAPVIINKEKRKGIQVVLDTDKYSVRHMILEELKRREVSANAGSDT